MSANDDILDRTIARQIALARYDAGLRRQVLEILQRVMRDIQAALPDVVTQTRRDRLNKQLAEVRALIAAHYLDIADLTQRELAGLAGAEANWQQATVNAAIGAEIIDAMPTTEVLAALARNTLIQGAPSDEWWSRQSADMQFRFTNAVRAGMAQSESLGQIVRRVRAEMDVATRNAYALVKTSTQTVAVAAREDVLRRNADVVAGKMSVATLDSRTTFECATYDGATYSLDNEPIRGTKLPYNPIPRHWNCRSVWTPVVRSFRELGLDIDDFSPSTRASVDGQVPATTTFDSFLKSKPKAWQDEYLGPGRAQLWRDGKITLSDLIDGTGRELTLDELREKFG